MIAKGSDSGYGYFIEIQYAGGFRSFYAQLNQILVNVGNWISITKHIACIGSTGVATESHLHYEVSMGRRFLNLTGWCYLLFKHLNDDFFQKKNTKIIDEILLSEYQKLTKITIFETNK